MKELKYVGKEKVRLLGPQIVTGKQSIPVILRCLVCSMEKF